MIKLKSLVICENAILSSDSKLSLINIFSEIKTGGLPVISPKFVIVVSVSGEVGHYNEKIEIVDPGNILVANIEGDIEIKGAGGNNFLANFVNIPFALEGRYWVKVSINNNKVLTNEDEHSIVVKKNI